MSALIWECIRDNHAYLKKGNGPKVFSAEPGNITNLHSNKFSGLAGRKVAGLTVVKSGKKETVTLVTKPVGGKRACPKSLFNGTGISKNATRATKSIAAKLAGYRPDLVGAAVSKFQKIKQSLRRK